MQDAYVDKFKRLHCIFLDGTTLDSCYIEAYRNEQKVLECSAELGQCILNITDAGKYVLNVFDTSAQKTRGLEPAKTIYYSECMRM